MKNGYTPRPVDTSDVVIPADIAALVGDLAKNVHELWAVERMRQGWTYGEERNDEKKETELLTEYEKLSEEEKEKDIAVVEGIIRQLMGMGYKIVKE